MEKIYKALATGQYDYEKNGKRMRSHCIYRMATDGTVEKFIPKLKVWIELEDINIKPNDYEY